MPAASLDAEIHGRREAFLAEGRVESRTRPPTFTPKRNARRAEFL